MIPSPELVHALQRDRERAIAASVLSRQALCQRACCDPGRFDRLARRLGRSAPCPEGAL